MEGENIGVIFGGILIYIIQSYIYFWFDLVFYDLLYTVNMLKIQSVWKRYFLWKEWCFMVKIVWPVSSGMVEWNGVYYICFTPSQEYMYYTSIKMPGENRWPSANDDKPSHTRFHSSRIWTLKALRGTVTTEVPLDQ